MPEKEVNIKDLQAKIDSLEATLKEMNETNQQLALALNEARIIKDALITQIRISQVSEKK